MAHKEYDAEFAWDERKEEQNRKRHGLDFREASEAFFDPGRIIVVDENHSTQEPRYFCIGKVKGRVVTVRFTYREERVRIIGAGYWRKGRRFYEGKIKKKGEC